MNIIKRIFSFGRSYDEFELLETEGGQPGFFGSAGRAHKDAAGAIETANDTVASDVSANEERLKTEMHAEINPDMVLRRFLLCGQIEALAVFTALFAYSDMMWPLIVNMNIDKMTLAAGISSLQGQHSTNYPVMMAGSALAMIPMLAIYLIFQKQFIEGIALTGTKA